MVQWLPLILDQLTFLSMAMKIASRVTYWTREENLEEVVDHNNLHHFHFLIDETFQKMDQGWWSNEGNRTKQNRIKTQWRWQNSWFLCERSGAQIPFSSELVILGTLMLGRFVSIFLLSNRRENWIKLKPKLNLLNGILEELKQGRVPTIQYEKVKSHDERNYLFSLFVLGLNKSFCQKLTLWKSFPSRLGTLLLTSLNSLPFYHSLINGFNLVLLHFTLLNRRLVRLQECSSIFEMNPTIGWGERVVSCLRTQIKGLRDQFLIKVVCGGKRSG